MWSACAAISIPALLQDDPPLAGDWVLVHVGFAMSKISEAEALDQIRILTALG